jgi:hypothetical protein
LRSTIFFTESSKKLFLAKIVKLDFARFCIALIVNFEPLIEILDIQKNLVKNSQMKIAILQQMQVPVLKLLTSAIWRILIYNLHICHSAHFNLCLTSGS